VAIADQGRDIPAVELPNLFRKFSRADDDPSRDTGLGLAICRGIVETHGGRIRAWGAKFTFTLPASESAAVAPASAGARRTSAARGQVRVMAVDDVPQALRYFRDVLKRAGYVPVADGAPADVPRPLAEHKPHLTLLDLVLPGTDGIHLVNHIRKTGDVPVIFPSVYGQDETVARAFDMGGDGLRGQALLANGTGCENSGGAPEGNGVLAERADGVLLRGRPEHRLRPEAGNAGRGADRADGHGVCGVI